MAGTMKWAVRLEAVFEDGRASIISEIGVVERPDLEASPGMGFGLTLAEGKTLIAQLQSAICQDQIHAAARFDRVCRGCGTQRPHHDTGTRTVQTLFGKIVVDAPRFRACRCGLRHDPKLDRLDALIPGRTTAEFDNIAAELGARHSFRDAAHILDLFVPTATQHNHATVRSRLAAVSDQIAARDQKLPHRLARSMGEPPSVFIDGTFVRALPFYQTRHFEVVMGRIDAKGQKSRHFATMPHVSAARCDSVRAVLRSQGWLPKQNITVFSDGDFSLVEIVRRASRAPLTHILDWFHVSMRIQHLRQCCGSLVGANQSGEVEFRFLTEDMNGLRSALWCGRMRLARTYLHSAKRQLSQIAGREYSRAVTRKVQRLATMVEEFDNYLDINQSSMPNYAERSCAGLPVSSSRAESTANFLVNRRMNKRRQMRWTPIGAQRVLQARVAVIDGRLINGKLAIAA